MELHKLFKKGVVTLAKPDPELPEDFIGIEVEVENFRASAAIESQNLKQWRTKDDGSLRNNGKEYFSIPLYGTAISQAIKEFCDHAQRSGLRATSRTGIHIHLNMSNVNDDTDLLRNFFSIYLLVEPMLFNMAGAWRKHCGYCAALYDCLGGYENWAQLFRAPDDESAAKALTKAVTEGFRYAALNLQALSAHGTVEFRMFPTVFDYDALFSWARIILLMKKAAGDFKLVDKKNPAEVASVLGKSEFFRKVFGDDLGQQLCGYEADEEFEERVSFIFSLLQPLQAEAGREEVLTDQDIEELDWASPGQIKARAASSFPIINKVLKMTKQEALAEKNPVADVPKPKKKQMPPNHLDMLARAAQRLRAVEVRRNNPAEVPVRDWADQFEEYDQAGRDFPRPF